MAGWADGLVGTAPASLSPAFLGHSRAEAEALSRSWTPGDSVVPLLRCTLIPQRVPSSPEGLLRTSGVAPCLALLECPGPSGLLGQNQLSLAGSSVGPSWHLVLPACPPETALSRHHGCRERLTCPPWCQLPWKGPWDGGPDLMAGRTVAGLCWACGSLSCWVFLFICFWVWGTPGGAQS